MKEFKSKAHRRRCQELVSEGKMKQETFDIMEKSFKESGQELPERVTRRTPVTRGTRRTTRTLK